MHTALSYDISPITPSNSDIDFFLPKHIHQYCFLPSWWLSPSNQLAFILGYTGMQTAFSSHAMLFCKVQLVSLPRRQSVPPSELVTNGELVVCGICPKRNRRVTEALEGSLWGHRHWSVDRKREQAGAPAISFLCPCSPLIILLGSHYQPPHLNWSIENCRARFHACSLPAYSDGPHYSSFQQREIHYSMRKTDSLQPFAYSAKSVTTHRLCHYFLLPKLLDITAFNWTGEGIEGRNGIQTVKMVIKKQKIHRKHNSFLRPVEI